MEYFNFCPKNWLTWHGTLERSIVSTHLAINAENLMKIALLDPEIIGFRTKGCYNNFWQFVQTLITITTSLKRPGNEYKINYLPPHFYQCENFMKFGLVAFQIIGLIRAWLVWRYPFKIRYHGNVPWEIGKRKSDPWSTSKQLIFGKIWWKSVWLILRYLVSKKSFLNT